MYINICRLFAFFYECCYLNDNLTALMWSGLLINIYNKECVVLKKSEWIQLGRARIINILKRHGVAHTRTLEQKISDAGPSNMRVEPQLLGESLKGLFDEDKIGKSVVQATGSWYFLEETPEEERNKRLDQQLPIYQEMTKPEISKRIGQCLEISIFKSLCNQRKLDFFGHYNLDDPSDALLFRKEEPPKSISGKILSGEKSLDFLVSHPVAGFAGIEAKNKREWLYPGHSHVTSLLKKCLEIDCVPVLVVRRCSFQTTKLRDCGLVLHQEYNQLFSEADIDLAEKAKHKDFLGFHDIRTGNEPSTRMLNFFSRNLPEILPEARMKFDASKDLIEKFANKSLTYHQFIETLQTRF